MVLDYFEVSGLVLVSVVSEVSVMGLSGVWM